MSSTSRRNAARHFPVAAGAAALVVAAVAAAPAARAEDAVARAKALVATATAPVTTWDGPTSGPPAQKGKTIVYVSQDQRNGGALGVSQGAAEAAKAIGWTFKIIDGQGEVAQQAAGLNQAITIHADGIILGTLDAVAQKPAINQALALGIKIVGWHAGPKPGPIADPKVFTNIESEPADISRYTADYIIAQSDGHAGVAVLYASSLLGRLKGDILRDRIKECEGCKVLSYDLVDIADAATRMPQLTISLKQRFQTQLTWMTGVNDIYFDFAIPALRSAGVPPSGPPLMASAGDGSVSAYGRIRAGQYQVATVPEPLYLQGWQAIDELNRAFAGAPPSGYIPKIHLVTKENVGTDGGPLNHFDPSNGYRDQYKKIWGVK